MEVAGLVAKGITDATPILWRKGARHSAGDRRLAEQHDQPDATNKGNQLDEKPRPWLARIAQPANGQGEMGNDLGNGIDDRKGR